MKILITASGTGTGYGYALSKAKYFPSLVLVTGDTNPAELVPASVFSNEHLTLPAFDEADYLETLNQAINDYAIDVYLPLLDPEINFAASHRGDIQCNVAVNSAEFCHSASLKSRYTELVQGGRVKVPYQYSKQELPNSQTIVVKRDGGFGGLSTKVVSSISDEYIGERWNIYEYIEGKEFTVDCFPVANGESVFTSVRERIETKSGVCTKARISQDSVLHEFAFEMVERFQLHHPFCFQTIQRGDHYLIDLNPRLGAATAMSALHGADFFAAHLELLCGGDPLQFLRSNGKSSVVTRTYTEYLMKVEV